MQRMRIFIQQKQSGLYFKGIEGWTQDRSAAMEFIDSTAAIDFCAANKLTEVQLVLWFDEEQAKIVMPVLPSSLQYEERPSQSTP